VTFEGFVTVAHLPLKSLTVPLISDTVQNVLAGGLIAAVAELNSIKFVFFGLFGLDRVHNLVSIDSGKFISKGFHELITPVFAAVSVKGTGVVRGLGRLSIVVIFHIQQHLFHCHCQFH
jgi:hypothetical protein